MSDENVSKIERRKDVEEPPVFADDGTDLTLIRWFLTLTPTERLNWLQNHMNAVAAIRSDSRSTRALDLSLLPARGHHLSTVEGLHRPGIRWHDPAERGDLRTRHLHRLLQDIPRHAL